MAAAQVPNLAPVTRLRAIRTLVIARDLAFRERAMTVLVELGFVAFAVVSLEAADDVLALVDEQRADVVVLDATGCAPAIARIVVQLGEIAPRVGIVVVSDEIDCVGHALPVTPKWGWATDLSRAVIDAYGRGNPLREEHQNVRTD
jgi:hypothetical protein